MMLWIEASANQVNVQKQEVPVVGGEGGTVGNALGARDFGLVFRN